MNLRGSKGVKDLFDVTAGRHIHPRGGQERVHHAVLRCVQRFACAGEDVCRVGFRKNPLDLHQRLQVEPMNHRGSNGVKDLFDVTAGRHIHPRGEQERVHQAVLRCVQRFACAGEDVCRVGF